MAETYSLEAVLSARDAGFKAGMKAAEKASSSLASKVKAGLGFGVFSAIGSKAVGAVTSGVTGLIGEMNSSSAAWKTFSGNMKTFGKESQIPKVRKELQTFAEQTIYSSSDMASTYAQLAAVGVKSADKLVMGFGGLASAAENPTQAMKTLSQQATQMAAKPTVQWQDFKLMLEQTPAGIAAVAKSMGKTTSQLVSDIQAGEVSTEDFFAAIEKVGNSKSFKEQARQYKTAGQALDGLKETMANKLLPTFEMVSDVAIKEIGGVVDSLGKIDGDKLATKVAAGMKAATPYFNMFKTAVKGVGSVIKTVGGFLLDHSATIAKVIPYVAGLVGAYKAFKIVKTFVPAVQGFAKGITSLAGKGIGGIAGKLFKIGSAERDVGSASVESGRYIMQTALSFLALGGGVLLIATGFYMIASAAVKLSEAGGAAIGVAVGMTGALAGLAYGASIIGPALSAGALGFLALGGAILMIGAGIGVATWGISQLCGNLPTISEYGGSAAGALVKLGGAVLTMGAMALAGGILIVTAGAMALTGGAFALVGASLFMTAGALILSSGVVAAVGGSLFLVAGGFALASGVLAIIGGGMFILFGGMLVVAAGMTKILQGALKGVNSTMKSISSTASNTAKSLKAMTSSVDIVKSGLNALGSKAQSAMNKVMTAFNNAAGKSKTAGKKVGDGFSNGMKSGLNKAPSIAHSAVSKAVSRMRSGYSGAYSAGSYIGQGLANGMRSQLGAVQSVAAQLAAAAEMAIRAEAKIHSPSKVAKKLGIFYGKAFGIGIGAMFNFVKKMSEKLVNIPNVHGPKMQLAGMYGVSELSDDYNYTKDVRFTVNVPLEIDGKEFARATADDMQEEQNRRQTRNRRKQGFR